MTIHDPSLRAALKTLKLTGMLDTLDVRLAQTRASPIGAFSSSGAISSEPGARMSRNRCERPKKPSLRHCS